MNIHHMPDADEERVPRKERQGLGYVIVNKMRDCFSGSEEHGLKLAVVLEAPKECLALLKEYNVVEQVQGRLINEKANVQYKYQKPLYEYHAAEVEKEVRVGWRVDAKKSRRVSIR